MSLRLIVNKYHEGDMKRTLKRELKELELVEQEANRHVCDGEIAVHVNALYACRCAIVLTMNTSSILEINTCVCE